jgi:hypothetical protein
MADFTDAVALGGIVNSDVAGAGIGVAAIASGGAMGENELGSSAMS